MNWMMKPAKIPLASSLVDGAFGVSGQEGQALGPARRKNTPKDAPTAEHDDGREEGVPNTRSPGRKAPGPGKRRRSTCSREGKDDPGNQGHLEDGLTFPSARWRDEIPIQVLLSERIGG